jgi:hypothetical protein
MMKLLLREIKDVYRFVSSPHNDKRVVLYSEGSSYFLYFEGILDALTNTYKIPIYYITSDPCDPIFQSTSKFITPFYIKTLLPYVMAFIKARVFVMTLTDLEQLHLRRSTFPVHYVYVFHALVSTHMMYREGAFDHYDTILCVGPHQIKEIRKREADERLGAKNLIEAGYYPLEKMYERFRTLPKNNSDTKTILIAPSWGEENVFERVGERLIRVLLEKGYYVIARPHPETRKRSPQLLTLLQKQFNGNALFELQLSGSPEEAILKADVLISDCSGITLEYAFGTERPVIFMDVPPKIKNPNYKKLAMEPIERSLRGEIGVVVSPDAVTDIPAVVERVLKEQEVYRHRIQRAREQYVYAFGHSADKSAQVIVDMINVTSSSS